MGSLQPEGTVTRQAGGWEYDCFHYVCTDCNSYGLKTCFGCACWIGIPEAIEGAHMDIFDGGRTFGFRVENRHVHFWDPPKKAESRWSSETCRALQYAGYGQPHFQDQSVAMHLATIKKSTGKPYSLPALGRCSWCYRPSVNECSCIGGYRYVRTWQDGDIPVV